MLYYFRKGKNIRQIGEISDAMEVTVCCAEGEEGHVYEGLVDFKLESIDLEDLEEPKTKLMMNVGNPGEWNHSRSWTLFNPYNETVIS